MKNPLHPSSPARAARWAKILPGLLLAATALAADSPGASPKVIDPEIQGEEKAVLTHAPMVPPPITRRHATKVLVDVEVKEVVRRLADGVDYLFWTFGGGGPRPVHPGEGGRPGRVHA
jgi:hypothetical protein